MKVENYLNSLKPKEFIYLMLSIPIIIFIVYNNFIYPELSKETTELHKTYKAKQKEFRSVISQIRILKNLDKILPPLEKKLQNDKEDYKYIKYALYDTPIILLNDKDFYTNLSKLLNISKKLNLNISTNIDNSKKYPPFSSYIVMNIKGSGNYLDIINFIRYIESIKMISYIDKVDIELNKKVDYEKLFQIKSVETNKDISINKTDNNQNINKYTYNFDININFMGIK